MANWKKIAKRTGKILLISLFSVLLLVAILLAVGLNSENYITQRVLAEVSRSIKAPVSVENITIRYFKYFPNLTVELSQLTAGNYTEDTVNFCFPDQPDGLLKLDKFYVALKIKPLLDNRIEIDKIEIDGFSANYCVDSSGKTNFDFLMGGEPEPEVQQEDTAASSDLFVLLSDLTLRNIQLNYTDQAMKMGARVTIPQMNIRAKVHNDTIQAKVSGKVDFSNLSMEDFNLSEIKALTADFSIGYDNDRVSLDKFKLAVDEMTIATEGSVVLRDSMDIDLSVLVDNADLAVLVRYLPESMMAENGIKAISGKIGLETRIRGIYYDTLLLPGVSGKYQLKDVAVATVEYPEIKKFDLVGDFSLADPNNLSTFITDIKQCKIDFPRSNLSFNGKISNLDKISYNINTSGNIDLADFWSFIPEEEVKSISGKIGFQMSTWGILPDKPEDNPDYFLERTNLSLNLNNLSVRLDSINEIKDLSLAFAYSPDKHIVLKNLSLEAPGYQIKLEPSELDIKLEGKVSDLDKLSVLVNRYDINMPGMMLNGNASFRGLSVSDFSVQTNLSVEIDRIKHLIPDSIADVISGKIDLEMKSYGTLNLDSIDSQMEKILFEQTVLSLKMQDFDFHMFEDTLVRVNNLALSIDMADDTIRVHNFSALAHGIQLKADSTQIWNVYRAFLKQERGVPLIVQTNLFVSEFDYNKFAPIFDENEDANGNKSEEGQATSEIATTKTDSQDSLPRVASAEETTTSDVSAADEYFPPMILRGKFSMGRLKYDDIVLQNIETLFRIDDSLYVIDKFRFDAWGGTMVTSAVYDIRKYPEEVIMFRNEIHRMDIHRLLVEAKDFDQTEFTYKNISGVITSNMDGRIVMVGDSVLYDKIMIRGRFKLENGGIYDYEPIKELGKFTNLRELENIVFRTLESGVFIYNNKIFFPKTDIVSTAADISAFGMVSFGDEYQLHLKVHLSDALIGKYDKLLKAQGKQSDLFDNETDKNRKGLYLLALNRNGETKYGFDNKSTQRRMSTEIRVQEQGLGLIFNPLLTNYSTELDRREVRKRQ